MPGNFNSEKPGGGEHGYRGDNVSFIGDDGNMESVIVVHFSERFYKIFMFQNFCKLPIHHGIQVNGI